VEEGVEIFVSITLFRAHVRGLVAAKSKNVCIRRTVRGPRGRAGRPDRLGGVDRHLWSALHR
jgi:hypothetical protein